MQEKPQDNFTPVSRTVQAAETFFARAAKLCGSHAGEWTDAFEQGFISYAAEACIVLSQDLRQARSRGSQRVLRHWQQYTPETRLPGQASLRALGATGVDAEQCLCELQRAAERFQLLHLELAERARTADIGDFHRAYSDVLLRFRQKLNSAYQQGQAS